MTTPPLDVEEDQHVVLRAMAWQDFEALLAIRGDRAGVRMYYLDGEIELTSSTKIHEGRKKTLARLLEIWAMESDVALNGFGSWTLKNEIRETGAEPDACYIVGDSTEQDVPDLAIEVEWSRATGLSKPEIQTSTARIVVRGLRCHTRRSRSRRRSPRASRASVSRFRIRSVSWSAPRRAGAPDLGAAATPGGGLHRC